MQISSYRHVEKVFKNFRQKLNLSEDAQVLDLIWGLFMSTTTKVSVQLGPNYNQKFAGYRNTNFEDLKNLFNVTQIEWTFPPPGRHLHCYAIKWTKAKVHVYSGSVFMSGEGARSFRSKPKMECSTPRISTVQFLQRIIWNRWRTD